MNDYDDSEDYSSANFFRARSNTWPLNRPDLAVPNSVCIDETLPEIELEEDDLFTTNENWSTGLIDHDIMSWDPILNAQNQQHNSNHQHQQIQHQPQQPHHHNHHQQQHQQQQQQSNHQQHNHHHQHQATSNTSTNNQQHHHQQNQATTVHHHHQPHHQPNHQRQPSIHHHPQQQISHQSQQQHETLLSGSTVLLDGQVQHQQTEQLPSHNQTHCLDGDDPSEYHIHQLHHLHLDNNQGTVEHQTHYVPSIGPMCIPGSTVNNLGNDTYNISSDHQHHHLQPLTSARYDLNQQNDLDLKALDNDQQHHQLSQLNHLTSTSLDHYQSSSHMLSSSLSTSGIGLSGDLEDLDYKPIDTSNLLQDGNYEDQQQIDSKQQQSNDSGASVNKQTSSTTSSKTKLNTPRRNAWGNMSYADLISQAINSTNDKRLTLAQIYDWMVQHVPYFKDKGDSNSSAGWKNSVRHNLSLHNRFKRLQNEGTGKSSWWTINPEANIGKCARRRAASMEASKYEKKRGRAKKRAEAVRQGLVSYPSLTNSSLNGSTNTLDLQQQQQQQQQQEPSSQFESQQHQIKGLNSNDLNNGQPSSGIYVGPTQYPQYEQKDNVHQSSRFCCSKVASGLC